MKKIRIIPRLDVKGPNVVKGIHLEGLRVVGKPAEFARKYYEQGADEILYIDIVASLYERNNLVDVVKEATSLGVFIPMTVGGGIRTLEDIKTLLRAGADKVAINTAATRNPELITKAAKMFGSQCIVGSIEAKKISEDKWEAYIDNGREKTGLDAVEWAKKLVELGAGELLITSVDKEGTGKGYDIELLKKIVPFVSVPVIACGGAGNYEDAEKCLTETNCDAVSMASILHYNKTTIAAIKEHLKNKNIPVRSHYSVKEEKNNLNPEKKTISIIDYGLGNLKSVISGFQRIGHKAIIISTPEEILKAESIVLPGVGAFEDGMKGLKERNLIDALNEYVNSGKPLLGICLGTQLLMGESEEFGIHKGLGIVKGRVVQFKGPSQVNEKNYRVPHMGWNSLILPKNKKWSSTILSKTQENSEVYFVHSFIVVPDDEEHILATTEYGGQEFCSLIKKGNIYGCQFHPEKSGEIGSKMLEVFGSLGGA